jgi:phage shock protein E
MNLKAFLALSLVVIITTLSGCSVNDTKTDTSYRKISSKEAKEMMDEDSDIIILDVRTQDEYDSGHIEGALLIPNDQISEKAESVLTDKDATILVYCRSGRRSLSASKELADLSYTNIYDFGGIIDWPYETVIK